MRSSPMAQLTVVVSAIPVLVGLALAAFAWPTVNLAPRDLPLGVVGPAQVTTTIATQLHAQLPGAFDIHTYANEEDARTAIRHREVYGAIVVGQAGTKLLIASAASALVASLLTQNLGTALAAQSGGQAPQVIDVVPASVKDPRGLGLGASVLPLVLAGEVAGLLLSVVSRPGWMQVAALSVAAILSGIIADAIVQGWLGALDGNWLANTGVFILTIFAIASTIAGLGALLGRVGLGLGAALMLFVGNPFSGITSAPALLPKAVAVIGQLLPPGAGGNLLRSTAFFGGEGAGGSLVVLCVWVLFGLVAITLGALRSPQGAESVTTPAATAMSATV